ncbi:MAG: 5-formyltetrahydrofolate cyclo-ligase [Methylicorpusculum sp.]|uniref:5-formyltetrahydrofolate cyclo-ligase n=2 Tax=Methylicorpusculum sp. TaxID=2713644 RepID=UPI0027196779|nr:5-formyltetrahydrofolate cyclo-ligase [Methylicorpusculum sp.]MDO8938694.1 5-formyltetrahydrofolate cyclo-ligase [Methylicorpusculum sp.]MDP2180285.1 5-formyltetrahydrofolate cyclo-ligase [Methylicorpusculum sp.]MDP2203214.1 5-formyltetrahydrofolate cyclo-ligase [Methylicorpusculum sp.]MDP3530390.1 5-formyltetrahydrofolate cyclo-ligase [Methylicorpusculum sp.]
MKTSDLTENGKAVQRRQAYAARAAQPNKDALSRVIGQKVMAHPAYTLAEMVMMYVGCKSEVRTVDFITQALSEHKRIVLPYCTQDAEGQKILGLWLLDDMSELVSGTWGILEPPKHRWHEQVKQVNPDQLDLIIVPGVAFDDKGGRLGNGAGYYDRLLSQLKSSTVLMGICYQSQLVDEVKMEPHDVYMDWVVTEHSTYQGSGRKTGK